MRFHYVGVRYYVCLREWRMYASEISREISFISNTISMHLPSGSPSAHPAPKHLQSLPLPVAFLLLLHQYCGVVWYETTALTSVTVRLSVSNKCSSHLKLRHVNFWAVEYYSHSGWQACSQDYQKGGYLRNIIAREARACVRKHARLGGSGGMPPQEIFKI